MARLANVKTGAIVEVRDDKVALLGAEWEPVVKKAPAKKAAAKKSDKS